MKIYMVELQDYDNCDSVGYFTEYEKAKSCREYLNKTEPSPYTNFQWLICEYNLDETDYKSLNKEFDERKENEFQRKLEEEKQAAIAEIKRLKAKYNL